MSKIQSAIAQAKRGSIETQPKSPIKPPRQDPNETQRTQTATLPLSPTFARKVAVDERCVDDHKVLRHDSKHRHSAEGAYRMLRTRVMRNMRSNDWRVLGVSSCRQNEGKTFTAINLAISVAAEIDQEVVLIDLDLRRPSVYRYLGVNPGDIVELGEYLDDEGRVVDHLLVCPGIERLACILSANPLERPSDVLASSRGLSLFTELRERLNPDVIIIVDLPPLLAADDALAVAPVLDAFLLVVAEGQAEREDLVEVQTVLQDFNHIGTVLNKSIEKDSRRASYY